MKWCPCWKTPPPPAKLHWTGVKLHSYLKEQLAIDLGYRTTVRWLHELNFHLRVPQPWPERQNDEQRKELLNELRTLCSDPQVGTMVQ